MLMCAFQQAPDRQSQNSTATHSTRGTTAIQARIATTAIRPTSSASMDTVSARMTDKSLEKDARPPSRSSNRFSAAFTRLRSASRSGSRSRPSSMVLHQSDRSDNLTGKDMKRRSTPLPLMWDDEDAAIAPWNNQKEEDVIETQEQRKQRIGLLPSPALDGSWEPSPEATQERNVILPADLGNELYGATPLEKWNPAVESNFGKAGTTSTTRVEVPMVDDTTRERLEKASQMPLTAPQNNFPGRDLVVLEGTSFHDGGAETEDSGSVIRTPRQKHTSSFLGPPSTRRSSISSIGSDDVDDIGASSIERTVSPVEQVSPSRQLQEVLHGPADPGSVSSERSRELPNPLFKVRHNNESLHRPQESRRTSRSSLPSQQRPQERKQPSWTWKSTSNTIVSPSLDTVAGVARLDSPTVPGRNLVLHGQAAVNNVGHAAPSDQNRTSQELHSGGSAIESEEGTSRAGGRSENPDKADKEHSIIAAVGDVPISLTASGRGRSRQPSRSPSRNRVMAAHHQSPGLPGQYPQGLVRSLETETQHPYGQPGSIPYAAASQEGIHDQRFGPAILDPRQQGAEYQLPGVGPPQEVPMAARGMNFFRSGGSQNQLKSAPQAQTERISPNLTAQLNQRTFSGDSIPVVQASNDQKDKRRSGIFGAFSRNSSISDGRQSRGNVTNSQSTRSSQLQDPALTVAQRAPDNVGKGNVLKKIQRSSTNASVATPGTEKKQNRLSRFGSIFRRTNSEAHRGNKLVKAMPKAENRVSTPPGSMANKSTYQGMQRSQASLPQLQSGQDQAQGLEGATYVPPENVPAPPGGWYAPTSRRSSYTGEQQPTLPQMQPSPQQSTRRLHSEGFRRHNNTTPEILSFVESPHRQSPQVFDRQRQSQQYEQSVPPQSAYHSPPAHMHSGMQPRSSIAYGQQRLSGAPPTRNFSYGSSLSQVSQSEPYYYQQAEHPPYQGSMPFVVDPRLTPTHSRNSSGAFGPANTYRMSVTDEDLEMMGPPPRNDNYLQQASNPALYGATHPYQVPPPLETGSASSSPYGRRTSPSWYSANYTHAPGPIQQASTPSMYHASASGGPQIPPRTPLGGSRAGSRANSMTTSSRPNSIIEGQVYQFPTVPQSSGYSPVRHPVMQQERFYGAQPVMANARAYR